MAIIFVGTQLGRLFEPLQDPRPPLKWGEHTVDRKQNIKNFCFFKLTTVLYDEGTVQNCADKQLSLDCFPK